MGDHLIMGCWVGVDLLLKNGVEWGCICDFIIGDGCGHDF